MSLLGHIGWLWAALKRAWHMASNPAEAWAYSSQSLPDEGVPEGVVGHRLMALESARLRHNTRSRCCLNS